MDHRRPETAYSTEYGKQLAVIKQNTYVSVHFFTVLH